MIKKSLKYYKNYIYIYIFSCFALLLCSHFSPLYEYNFSVDPSIYLTIGRGINEGLIPYKDLLDIKGPIIFFIYALFSSIKIGTNYFGIFLLEIVALLVSVTFIYKTIFFVSKSKIWSFALTLIYPFILLNHESFINGGEAEEFILPAIFILIYTAIKIIKNNYHASNYQYFIQGLLFGYVFWIKYTSTGAWIAFFFCLIFILFFHKNYHELYKLIYSSFLGFIIPTILIFGYFIFNHALNDFLWGYFGWNYIYGGSTHEGFFKQLFFMFFHSFSIFFKRNIIIWILAIGGAYLTILSSKLVKNYSAKILLLFMTFNSMFLELLGGKMYAYYQLMAIPFCVFTFCWIAIKLKKIKFNEFSIISIISIISTMSLCGILIFNPNVFKSKLTGYTPYQERFAKIILKKDHDPTLLDFNELDHGWYNYLNIYPPTKYFNKMNLHYTGEYKPYINSQLNIINNKKVKYVICSQYIKDNKYNKYIFKNYKIIASQKVNDACAIKVLLLERK